MTRRCARALGLGALLLSAGCERGDKRVGAGDTGAVDARVAGFEPHMHWPRLREPTPVTREDAKVLEFVSFDEPVGEGYERGALEVGKPLYTGKWLGLSWGNGDAFGDHHVIVNVFGSRPRDRFHQDIRENVLLDVNTGESGPSFARRMAIDWKRGRALVQRPDDSRVYLLDAKVGELVSVYPQKMHPYVFGRNYWVELGERVWIVAEDADGIVHLFEWEDLSQPPPMPANPFPFRPEEWRHTADHVEVWRRRGQGEACTLAILVAPRSYRCLDAEWGDGPILNRSEPLVDGWRFINRGFEEDRVLNIDTGENLDFAPLCSEADGRVFIHYVDTSHEQVLVTCTESQKLWGVWSPERGLQIADVETAKKIHERELSPDYNSMLDVWVFYTKDPEGIMAMYNVEAQRHEIVGRSAPCPLYDSYSRNGGQVYGGGCDRGNMMELVHRERRLRSRRFSSRDLVIMSDGTAAVVRTQGSREAITPLRF